MTAETKQKRRRWPVVLLAGVVGLATGGLVTLLAASGPGVGHFRTLAGQKAYVSAYQAAIATLPKPTQARDVATSFGTVHAYVWINSHPVDDVPVVLLPGRASGVPMWGTNLPDFAAHRTVYAFDAIGDSGLSTQTIPMRDIGDSAQWVEEALAGLDLERVHLVGHSQGGGLAATVAVRYPGRIASLTLLEPIMTLGIIPAWAVGWTTVASLPGMPKSWRDHALNKIGGVKDGEVDPNDPMVRMIAAGSEHFDSSSLPTPNLLTDRELRGLRMPVYVALASDDSLSGDGAQPEGATDPACAGQDLAAHHTLAADAGQCRAGRGTREFLGQASIAATANRRAPSADGCSEFVVRPGETDSEQPRSPRQGHSAVPIPGAVSPRRAEVSP
ncbi:alpha/beta fold hydrolase [Fodinicola feengrottensis]|uniref:alpha/beta fold hydrolase n=1 Tax=Fodinicola feengrottensis TaxID=435914 RepID=UPI0036F2C564